MEETAAAWMATGRDSRKLALPNMMGSTVKNGLNALDLVIYSTTTGSSRYTPLQVARAGRTAEIHIDGLGRRQHHSNFAIICIFISKHVERMDVTDNEINN